MCGQEGLNRIPAWTPTPGFDRQPTKGELTCFPGGFNIRRLRWEKLRHPPQAPAHTFPHFPTPAHTPSHLMLTMRSG